jgi:hypothetical protein
MAEVVPDVAKRASMAWVMHRLDIHALGMSGSIAVDGVV